MQSYKNKTLAQINSHEILRCGLFSLILQIKINR